LREEQNGKNKRFRIFGYETILSYPFKYAIHLQVWHDIASTGMIDNDILIEKGWGFLQIMEPVFDEFLATIQNLEQKDERDFTYRKNRYKEIKYFPAKLLDTLEKGTKR